MDNYDLFLRHEAQKEVDREKLPVCIECRQPIQDDRCYMFSEVFICDDCMEINHRVKTEEYI